MSEGKGRGVSPLRRGDSAPFFSSLLFLNPHPTGDCPPATGVGHLPYSAHQFKRQFLLEAPSQTHPETFYQLHGHPLTQ